MRIQNVFSHIPAALLLAMAGTCLDAAAAANQGAKLPAAVSSNAPMPAFVAPSTNVVEAASNKIPRVTAASVKNPASPDEGAEGLWGDSPKIKPHYNGSLRAEYDYRSQGSSKDTDLYGYWNASARDLSNGHLDLYTSGRLHRDLDRSSSAATGADTTFTSLDDLPGVTDQRLQQLYADLHDQDRSAELLVGRQYVDVVDYLHLDGAQLLLFENDDLGGRIYAGRPVSYYASVTGDVAVGVSFVGRPWTGNQTRLTYAQYDDKNANGTDRNYFIDMQQEIDDAKWMRAQVSVLNGDFRMGSLDVYCVSPDGRMNLYFGGSRWGTFDAQTQFYSPLYSVLGEQAPYTYGYVRLTQALSRHLTLSPGVSYRITDSDEAEVRNRDYSDFDLTLSYEPDPVFSGSISADYWNTQGGDSFVGVSGEVRCRGGRKWEVSLGTAYVDYTYNSFSDISYSINGGQTYFTTDGTVITETPYSYTYYLRTKWSLRRNLTLRLEGDIEDDSTVSDLNYWGRASIEVRL